ncbi:MAG: hypothetical protein ABSA86_11200 [Oryzomonas sp.]|jgi:hypothetical protein
MKSHLRTLSLLALSLLSALPASATSVVCIRTADSIVIAADSRLAIRGADNPGKERKECKIIQAGGMFFSMTGFIKDPARPYDAAHIVAEALERPAAPLTREGAVTATVAAGLRDELAQLRAEAPELYNRYMRDQKGTLLKVLLAGFEGDTPQAVLFGFRHSVTPLGEITVTTERESCPGNCDPQGAYIFIMGERRPIDAYLKNNKADLATLDTFAKSLVELVIDAHTPDVGPPVDVLRIDRDGAGWIEKKAECPDIVE